MNDKGFYRCACCDQEFYSMKACREHFDSLEHKMVAGPAWIRYIAKMQQNSLNKVESPQKEENHAGTL